MKLIEYFLNNHDRNLIHKPMSYFPVYERHFDKFVGKNIKVLEIGVAQGGSVKMWKEYFGKKAEIVGVDINPKCSKFEEPGIKIYIGDQADTVFLGSIIEKEKAFDIIMDDGGHHSYQQIASFKYLFNYLKSGGVYLCEDIGTNYNPLYNGGYKKPGTFVEYCKSLIDELNACSSMEIGETLFTHGCVGIHFYDSMIAFDKGLRAEHDTRAIGRVTI